MSNKLAATFHGALPGAYHPEPEQEHIGDWAGHTPTIDAEIQKGQDQLDADRFHAAMHRANINDGIRSLVTISGENSRDHGFHDDFPVDLDLNGKDDAELGLHVTQKLMLMAEELLESFGEIRSGRAMDEIYFVDKKGLIGPKGAEYPKQVYGAFAEGELVGYGVKPSDDTDIPLLKPEGFIVEIADLFIRGADLTYLLGLRGHLVSALEIKHEYNRTRPFKHGRQF